MNKRTRQAALRIQLLIEEYSPQELNEALELLGGKPDEDLRQFLERITSHGSSSQSSVTNRAARAPKQSRALEVLRDAQPEKYQLLQDFERQLLEGSRLRTLHDLRSFGQLLDKQFDAGKSRQEGIARLIKKLAEIGLDDLRDIIRRAPTGSVEDSDAFLRLSRHIISAGKDRGVQAE